MSQIKVVCIGGGTGLATILRGLKKHTTDLTAVVTVADNGGSSGNLRKEMHILPPGDIRNCLAALAVEEPMVQALLQYRFTEGALQGHSLGNLFIAGMADMMGSFAMAVEKAHEVLRVRGKVLPVTIEDVQLKATYDDGTSIVGECEIVAANKSHKRVIKEMTLTPSGAKAYSHVVDEIIEADLVILGPGSLYTSVVPNLLVEGVSDAIARAKGKVVYISNLMTQPGETDGFTLLEHVQVVEQYLGNGTVDYIIANDGLPESGVIDHYGSDGAQLVLPLDDDPRIITVPMLIQDATTGYVRHDRDKLAEVLIALKDS